MIADWNIARNDRSQCFFVPFASDFQHLCSTENFFKSLEQLFKIMRYWIWWNFFFNKLNLQHSLTVDQLRKKYLEKEKLIDFLKRFKFLNTKTVDKMLIYNAFVHIQYIMNFIYKMWNEDVLSRAEHRKNPIGQANWALESVEILGKTIVVLPLSIQTKASLTAEL